MKKRFMALMCASIATLGLVACTSETGSGTVPETAETEAE